jgi:hypothetical protein
MRIAPVFALLFFVISACDQVEESPIEIPGPEYFPLETGRYVVYNVDSTNILLNVESTSVFQLRVSVGTSFINGEGNPTYVIQRHKRASASKPWAPAGTWAAWKSIRQAVVSEGNTSYVTDELLKKDIRIEKYRKDVGLIYKETEVLEYCDDGPCFGTGFVKNGLRYKQEMVESGTLQ